MGVAILTTVLLCLTLIDVARGQCSAAKTCTECIKTHHQCQWCKDANYSAERCQSNITVAMFQCDAWVNPRTEYTGDENGFTQIVQVQPTAIRLKLRPGEEKHIPVQVKSSADYPLDLYYLMDFSFSMKNDLDNLKRMATSIADTINQISSNYSLGFGTFVDKPTSPYANTEAGNIEHPCTSCQAVHSFNHEMDITSGSQAPATFKTKLENIKISSNIDNPEGGFDAIVQAAMCSDIVGWRTPSRKVIFYASDAVFHTAGDGKLAGIVKTNTGTCGMTDNKYTRSLEEDYPSVGQLNDILIGQKVIPIFAVTSEMQTVYKKLSEQLTQLSSVGKLSEDSTAVAELIKDQLAKLISSTKLNPQAPTGVTVKVVPLCKGNQEETPEGCENVSVNENVDFDVIFKVEECFASSANSYKFIIDVPGIASVQVDIEMICDCECEKDTSEIEYNSKDCNNQGDLICGACECTGGSFGEQCQCDQNTEVSVQNCTNPDTNSICGGENNGRCICGECECIPPNKQGYRRWGKYCHCSNYECPRNLDYMICSRNGYCDCGTCQCDKTPNGTPKQSSDPEFTGPDCGCPVSTEKCKNPDSEDKELLCSGKGSCECGACKCEKEHYGEFCDICQDCGPLDCTIYVECVKCIYADEKGTLAECKCDIETSKSINERVDTSKLGRHKQCLPIDDPDKEGCSIIYYLHYKDLGTTQQPKLIEILIDREPDCPSSPNIIAIVAGVIGGILGVGIFLLILLKIFISIVDKREYNKFIEERSKAKWNSGLSPLYKEPMTKYTNPLYTAASSRI